MKTAIIILFMLLALGCSKKSYLLDVGQGGSANVRAGVMQQELIDGSVVGPVRYCSTPIKENDSKDICKVYGDPKSSEAQ